jgi:hypothetical protein
LITNDRPSETAELGLAQVPQLEKCDRVFSVG